MKRRRQFIVYALLICLVFFGITASVKPAKAAGRTGISGYVYGIDADNNPVAYSPAAALVSSQGEYYVFSSLAPCVDTAAYYIYISLEGNGFDLEMYGMDNTLGVVQWTVTSGSPDASFYSLGVPYQNEVCDLYYLDESGNESQATATLTGMSVENNYAFLTASGGPNSAYYPPAMLVDGNGNCVALATEGGVWGILASEDSFYADSGNDNGNDNGSGGGNNTGNDNGSGGGNNTGNDNGSGGGNNTGNDNGNNGTENKKSGGIQKYWWILLIGGGLIGGGIFLKKRQENGSGKDASGASQDISFGDSPYAGAQPTPIQPASIQPTPIQPASIQPAPIQPASIQPAPAPMQNTYGKVEEIGATTPVGGSKACKLCAVGGYMDGRVYPMDAREVTFGRDVSVSIRYPSDAKGVSRVHCKLYWQGSDLMLVDLGSSYGTFVEGKGKLSPQTPVVLKEGDRFCIGEQRNMFVIKKA